MTKNQSLKFVHAGRVQVFVKHTLVVAFASAIEQPAASSGLHVDGAARAQIEYVDLDSSAVGPVRMFEVIMAGRYSGEKVHDGDDKTGQTPVRVVESNREPRQ